MDFSPTHPSPHLETAEHFAILARLRARPGAGHVSLFSQRGFLQMSPITPTGRTRGLLRTLFAALALVAAGAPAHATSVIPMNVVDLLAHSSTILTGQVQSVTDGFDARGLPYTEVTIKVSDTIRGQQSGTYTFRQLGLDKPRALPDGRVYLGRPTGWPTWRKHETAIVFMYPKARVTGLQTTVGLGQGKLNLANGVAANSYDNATLFKGVKVDRGLLDASEQKMFDKKKGPVDSETLRRFLHRAVDGNWVKKGSIASDKR